jgi:hypothetical protein
VSTLPLTIHASRTFQKCYNELGFDLTLSYLLTDQGVAGLITQHFPPSLPDDDNWIKFGAVEQAGF